MPTKQQIENEVISLKRQKISLVQRLEARRVLGKGKLTKHVRAHNNCVISAILHILDPINQRLYELLGESYNE